MGGLPSSCFTYFPLVVRVHFFPELICFYDPYNVSFEIGYRLVYSIVFFVIIVAG